MNCKNHPDREAVGKCASCEEEFCQECLSQYQGKDYCAPCLKAEVTIATARLGGGGHELARMKKSLIGCSVVLLVLVLTPIFLLIYPCFKLGDVGRCRAKLNKIYKALVVYAEENDGWFPPNNNDLKLLFTEDRLDHIKDMKLFVCPGAKGAFGTMGDMGDSIRPGQRFPPGMSYNYQGGLPEQKKSPKALMWDRSSRNHRGKGINVLHTDGAVKFKKGLSRIKLRRIMTDR